jgi:hypothetical protein
MRLAWSARVKASADAEVGRAQVFARAGRRVSVSASQLGKPAITEMEVEVMQNLAHNRRAIIGVVLAIVVIAAIVLVVAYSGGHGGGGGY